MHVSKVLGEAFDREAPTILSGMVDQKQLGRKSGQGFYLWQEGKAVKPVDPTDNVPANLTDRLILPMVNEAVACLTEGVVRDADLLDAGVIFGTGFAPFRGGPLQYARDRGVSEITEVLEQLAVEYGEEGGARFKPHEGWQQLQESGT
jgi:3-hydroxyacyl-CoA dehydrogenase/enoyl-CoA hydratase/3-hydroxybutyryl-CoA epimerase